MEHIKLFISQVFGVFKKNFSYISIFFVEQKMLPIFKNDRNWAFKRNKKSIVS